MVNKSLHGCTACHPCSLLHICTFTSLTSFELFSHPHLTAANSASWTASFSTARGALWPQGLCTYCPPTQNILPQTPTGWASLNLLQCFILTSLLVVQFKIAIPPSISHSSTLIPSLALIFSHRPCHHLTSYFTYCFHFSLPPRKLTP